MAKIDPFTARRIMRFTEDFRAREGQLPTYTDFEAGGISEALVKDAVREKIIEEFYVTLTNGTIRKGFKVSSTP